MKEQEKNNKFVHLHVHSHYSLLDGLSSIKGIVSKAKELGQEAVALTDHANIFGAIEFYKQCQKECIKPILGFEAYLVENIQIAKENKERKAYHLTLLAMNHEGWKNIIRLVSKSNSKENFYYKPLIDFELLEKHSEGLIVLSGCMAGIISQAILNDENDKAFKYVEWLNRVFGDRLYFETQNGGIDGQYKINEGIRKLAKEFNRKIVATVDSHYLNREDSIAHIELKVMDYKNREAVLSSGFGLSSEFYFKDFNDIDLPFEERINTVEVADRCNVEIDLKARRFPAYVFTEEDKEIIQKNNNSKSDSETLLRVKLNEGWEQKLSSKQKRSRAYKDRCINELDVILQAGFADYFLIIADIVNWAKSNGIWVGPSRGSAAGSLLLYLLGVTAIDPIENGLIFERFYNSGREGSAPDVDVDIELRYRKQVIEYIKQRFGTERVFQLATFGTMAARAVLKDLMRFNNIDFDEANKITDCIPAKNDDHAQISLSDALEKSPELKLYSDDENYKKCFEFAKIIEGTPKAVGTHAAAVIILGEDVDNGIIPLVRSPDGQDLLCAWDMDTIDGLNILKCDILGLKTLELLHLCSDFIKERHGNKIDIYDLYKLSLDDKKAYDLICSGDTNGIFQLESPLCKKWCKVLLPRNIDDVTDFNALIRPGAMECLSGDVKILYYIWERENIGKIYEYKTINKLYREYIKITNLKNGIHISGFEPQLNVLSVDLKTGDFVKNKILRIVKAGIKDVYEVNLCVNLSGKNRKQRKSLKIKASLDHRFLTLDGWKKLKDLTKNDYIGVVSKRLNNTRRKNKYADGWRNFKEICFQNYIYKCIFCDWDKGALDVNHIDVNRYKNNNTDNLCFVCPNHHRMICENTITKQDILNYREFNKLPNTKRICFYKFYNKINVGTEETYDIEMTEPYNNFVAGDFIVHNSGMLDNYNKVRFNEKQIEYIHPLLEPILKKTNGQIIFQEQITEICTKIAKMSLQEGDWIRKVVGKKRVDELKKCKKDFIDKCIVNSNLTKEIATQIWEWIEPYGGYGLNLSHSRAYSIIGYWTAYFKANYPLEFFTSCLICSRYDQKPLEEIWKFVNDAKLFGINVLQPDLRLRNIDFAIDKDNNIRFGLSYIKGIGQSTIDAVSQNVDYKNFYDFIFHSGLNKRVIEGLICSGALDYFGLLRYKMLDEFSLFDRLSIKQKELIISLFDQSVINTVNFIAQEESVEILKEKGLRPPSTPTRVKLLAFVNEFKGKEFLSSLNLSSLEKEYLGIVVGKRQINYNDKIISLINVKKGLTKSNDNISVVGYILDVKDFITKKTKQKMAFVTLEDNTYALDNIVVFPKVYEEYYHVLSINRLVKIDGKLDNGGFLANRIVSLG